MPQSAKCVQRHTAFIYDRGARKRISPVVDLSRVRWERGRDSVSEGMIRIEGEACDRQSSLIDRVRSHRHELVIFRGDLRVWEGPIHRVTSRSTFAEIHAKDVLSYVGAQPLTQDWNNSTTGTGSTEVTTRLEGILEYELTHGRTMRYYDEATATWTDLALSAWEDLDPPINVLPYLDVRHFPNEARTSARTLPFEMSILEHLQGMGRQSGIDFTVVGRSILIWDVSRSLGRLQPMTGADFFSDVIVTEYGADHTQAAYVVAEDGLYGSAVNPANLDYYGPWTAMYTTYNEEGSADPSQSDLDSQAIRNLAGRSPAPLEVRVPDNSSIVLTDRLTVNHLVPGVQIPLRATMNARNIAQMQKIDHVTVTETGEGENVQVTLTPATRADSDEEAP